MNHGTDGCARGSRDTGWIFVECVAEVSTLILEHHLLPGSGAGT